jgi:anionic cell wall polymer biosynthesis LytR-Cps2A-Psr (LCP) family protein
MMVLTLDPVTKQGGVLSFPPDLWGRSPAPGGRINTAHFLGDLYGYTGAARHWRKRR